ncbi:MAG: Na+/Picotransporter [bacterium 42_11]|nr:MAG: Na+/Picotransporter [bacterium 42_11]
MREVFLLPAGLVLFLYGIRVLGEGLKDFLKIGLRDLFSLCERKRALSFLVGVLLSLGVQSSAGAVSLLASMINVGLISFLRSMDIMIGASLGNTITTQILAFRVADYSPYMLALGYFTMIFSKGRLRSLGVLVWGLGLVFFSMFLMQRSFSGINLFLKTPVFSSSLFLFFFGAILTMLFQSSALVLGLAISVISERIISLREAFFIVLGAHLGASFVLFMVSLGMRREAKALAWASLLYRAFGTLLSLSLYPFLIFLATFFPPERGVAMLHLSVTTVNALPFIFSNSFLTKLSLKIAFGKGEVEELTQPAFLDDGALEVPEWACYLALKEGLRVGTFLEYQFLRFSELLLGDGGKPSILREMEDSIRGMVETISNYLGRVGDMAEEKLKIYTFLGDLRQASELLSETYFSLSLIGFRKEANVNREKLEGVLDAIAELLKISLGAFALSDKFMARKAKERKRRIEEDLKRILVDERFIDRPGWLEFASFAKRFSDQCYYIVEAI